MSASRRNSEHSSSRDHQPPVEPGEEMLTSVQDSSMTGGGVEGSSSSDSRRAKGQRIDTTDAKKRQPLIESTRLKTNRLKTNLSTNETNKMCKVADETAVSESILVSKQQMSENLGTTKELENLEIDQNRVQKNDYKISDVLNWIIDYDKKNSKYPKIEALDIDYVQIMNKLFSDNYDNLHLKVSWLSCV